MSAISTRTSSERPRLGNGADIALWTLQALAAGVFLFAGAAKLYGAQKLVATFEQVGLGQWFRYFTGGVEIIAAIVMLIPTTSCLGAVLLAVTMACATLTHLLIIGGNPLPAIALLAIMLLVAWYRRPLSLSSTAAGHGKP